MTIDNDRRLTAKEVAEILGFTTTNLKHYAGLLEQNGLELFRNTRNHREYAQQDVKLLRAMQRLNRDKSIPLDEAASFVMSSDTDIDAILAQGTPQVVATNEANTSVVTHDSGNAERVLAEVLALLTQRQADYTALEEQLAARDKLMLEMQSEVSTQLQEQAATIDGLRGEIEELRKLADKPTPSLWVRLFGAK